ncbi:MAG: endolytic transglycosylase MltG [Alphaproteobacteria bacterium]|nr:endolytic transglycosylase MltG [Alphaproteobacteria bacterium]
MKRKKKLFGRIGPIHLIVGFVALVLMLGVYIVGWRSPVSDGVTFRVDNGAAVSAVAARLRAANLIASPDVFKAVVMIQGGKIQTGTYDIPPRASAFRIARMMARGDVASTLVVIPEGLTIRQIKNLLLDTAALTGPVECDVADRPVCNLHDGDVFPDTYRVARGMNRLAVLELMRRKMVSIQDSWNATGGRAPAPLKTWNDVITLASIVQKETPRASEMPIVASVYLNRLKQKMRLQADPTVVYAITGGLGDMQGRPLLRDHLKTDSPYNTYTNHGLPPAPIANVGRNAIAAVLDPADTNYLFFVADGQGGHKFSGTYAEHQKNHADWRAIKKFRNAQSKSVNR